MPKRPLLTPEEIEVQLDSLSRQPFRQVLADVLASAPSMDDIRGFASRNPDRWGQLLAIVAKLGGYHDKLEVEGNMRLKVEDMSDAELVERIKQLEGESRGQEDSKQSS